MTQDTLKHLLAQSGITLKIDGTSQVTWPHLVACWIYIQIGWINLCLTIKQTGPTDTE